VAITVVNFLMAMNFYLLMMVVAKFATDRFDASPAMAGLAASIFVVGGLITRPLAGRLIHRLGQLKTLYLGVVMTVVWTALYFAAADVGLLLLVRLLHGAAFGITSVTTATMIVGVIPSARYGEGIGYFTLSQTLATAIGPFVGLLLLQHGSFDAIVIASTAVPTVGLLMMPSLRVREMRHTVERRGRPRKLRLSDFVERAVIPIALAIALVYLGYASVMSFLALYAQDIGLMTAASGFFVVLAVVVFVSRPFVGRRFDSKGENSVIYPAIVMLAVGMVLLSQARHSVMLLLAAVAIGLGFGAVQSSGQTIAVKLVPSHRVGFANSTFFAFMDIGVGMGPWLCGLLVPLAGYRGMYGIMAAVMMVGLALYYALHGRRAPGDAAAP